MRRLGIDAEQVGGPPRRAVDDVLAVVEHEERGGLVEPGEDAAAHVERALGDAAVGRRLADAERRGEREHDVVVGADARELDDDDEGRRRAAWRPPARAGSCRVRRRRARSPAGGAAGAVRSRPRRRRGRGAGSTRPARRCGSSTGAARRRRRAAARALSSTSSADGETPSSSASRSRNAPYSAIASTRWPDAASARNRAATRVSSAGDAATSTARSSAEPAWSPAAARGSARRSSRRRRRVDGALGEGLGDGSVAEVEGGFAAPELERLVEPGDHDRSASSPG